MKPTMQGLLALVATVISASPALAITGFPDLSGEAPIHLAIFSDEGTTTGRGLGRQTMPETLRYSVVGAVQTMWLAARAEGLGMGWVSIFDPVEVRHALDVPESWTLVAYLDIGWPAEEHLDPELERHHWEARHYTGDLVFTR